MGITRTLAKGIKELNKHLEKTNYRDHDSKKCRLSALVIYKSKDRMLKLDWTEPET